jgi:hypothetical protein
MFPRSAAEGQKVNNKKADEVFGEDGSFRYQLSGITVIGRLPIRSMYLSVYTRT